MYECSTGREDITEMDIHRNYYDNDDIRSHFFGEGGFAFKGSLTVYISLNIIHGNT